MSLLKTATFPIPSPDPQYEGTLRSWIGGGMNSRKTATTAVLCSPSWTPRTSAWAIRSMSSQASGRRDFEESTGPLCLVGLLP